MSLFIRSATCLGLLCLGLMPSLVLAQEASEAPPGYEDAPAAKKPAPAAQAEAPPGYEDAAMANEAAPPVEVRGEVQAEAPEASSGSLLDALAEALTDNNDPNVANLEREFLPQFQPLVKAEQAFVQRACGLNKEQRAQIAKAGDECLKAAARKYALAQNQWRNGRGVRIVGGQPVLPDPRGLVQQHMAGIVQSKLRPEQAEQYRQECDKRAAHRKDMAVRNLVAELDERLVLTAEQRDKLVESLASHWQDAWAQSIQMLLQSNQYLPSIPDQHVVPFLNEKQKAAWRNIAKQGTVMFGDFDMAPMMVTIEDSDVVEDTEGKRE